MTPGELSIIRHIEEQEAFGNPSFENEFDPEDLESCVANGWVRQGVHCVTVTMEGRDAAANEDI